MKTYHVAPGSHGLIITDRPMIGHESSIAFVEEDNGQLHVVLADANTGICLANTSNTDLLSTLTGMMSAMEEHRGSDCLASVAHVNFANCERMG